jgi:hypothetical protein
MLTSCAPGQKHYGAKRMFYLPVFRRLHGLMSRHRLGHGILVAAILSSLWFAWSAPNVHAQDMPPRYAGWAVEAYPEQSAVEMQAMVQRIVDAGSKGTVPSLRTVIWIGHNNPGEVDADKVEPGLSYAVYEAFQEPADPRHEAAVAIVQSQRRMLEACRAVGVQAVLPVGYQIQMGETWNAAHPTDLRMDASGRPLDIYGGGVSASFYAPAYRRDIETYYRWVEAEFVRPYADVLLMLNLADEPIGGDYSPHAAAEFRRLHGIGFEDVGSDPARQRLLGEFQSRYVVEYATYSAELWHEIRPGLPVTMSFDGAQARKAFSLPEVEALFRDTPSNFVITFDAYPRDGLPHIPLSDKNLVGLFLLARSVGLYASRYDKPVWLWGAANSWGLGQASPDPGTISDAVANGLYLALLVRQAGGRLQGIAYWNYNVKEQGLYNDTHDTAYDKDTMFAQVSAGLPGLRRLMSAPPGRPEVLVLAPPAVSHQEIGATREAVRLEVQPYQRLAILAKEGVSAAVVSALDGWPLDQVRAIVVLSPEVDFLAGGDLAILGTYLSQGGKVVASRDVGAALAEASGSILGTSDTAPQLAFDGLIQRQGDLYIAQKGVAVLFEDKRHSLLSPFWREVLDLYQPQPGYRVVTNQMAFHYHLGPDPVQVRLVLPFEGWGYRYDDQAQPVERLRGWRLTASLGRREYILLKRSPRSLLRAE